MKKWFKIAACVAVATILMSIDGVAFAQNGEGYAKSEIRDLVLIYQGGAKRIDWTEDQFVPYVTHRFADGKREWLFDGFLFLDFNDGKGNTFIPVYGARNAGKTEWEWYLGRLFEKGKSLDALNSCIERQKAELGAPSFKHKVVLSIPTPITGHTDWGELDGRKLDFNNYADQTLAVSWFIDQLVGRFQSEGYENLELVGLYWVDEDICHTKELVKYVSPLVHEKGLDFVWIPYFKARGYDRWRELGFDIAYHQPNHFFDKSIPDSRLDEACDIAFELGMAMEFECDSKALFGIEDSSYERMKAYIEVFRRKHVFDDSAIAYYTGSKGFIDMAENPCVENQSIMDELARIIVERRHNKNLLP